MYLGNISKYVYVNWNKIYNVSFKSFFQLVWILKMEQKKV